MSPFAFVDGIGELLDWPIVLELQHRDHTLPGSNFIPYANHPSDIAKRTISAFDLRPSLSQARPR